MKIITSVKAGLMKLRSPAIGLMKLRSPAINGRSG